MFAPIVAAQSLGYTLSAKVMVSDSFDLINHALGVTALPEANATTAAPSYGGIKPDCTFADVLKAPASKLVANMLGLLSLIKFYLLAVGVILVLTSLFTDASPWFKRLGLTIGIICILPILPNFTSVAGTPTC